MELSAPTTITLRRPSADADLIISRHDDGVCGGGAGSGGTARDVTDRQVSYSDPGSASDSSPEGSRNALSDCIGQAVSRKKTKKKKKTTSSTNAKGCAEGRLRCGVRRASDCLREAVKRCQQQLQLCNENKSKSAMTLLTVIDPAQKYAGQGQGHIRKVSIEMCSQTGRRQHKNKARSYNNLDLVSRSSAAFAHLPPRNMSASMTVLELREGTFTAQIPLKVLSDSAADVTVKVTDSSLELFVDDDDDAATTATFLRDVKRRRSNAGHYRGTINLPDYVDSGRVQFDVVGQSLRVKAAMKGCGSGGGCIPAPLSASAVKSSSTLDLSCLHRHRDSSKKRRKSANDVNVVTSLRDPIKLQTAY